jgi:hypothetical protein
MSLEEHTVDDALPDRCEVCGTRLTSQEVQAARETDAPFLCTVHAAEELPAQEDPERDE